MNCAEPPFRLYLVADESYWGDDFAERIAAAVEAGVRGVQLRAKSWGAGELLRTVRRLQCASGERAHVLVNDRVDVCLLADCAGVHLPASGISAADARRLLGTNRYIAVSTHSVEEVIEAQTQDADFVVFGPVFDTPSKRPYGQPLGLEALAEVCAAVEIPVLAIGGIDPVRAADCRSAGAAGVAAIRGIFDAPDIPRAVAAYADAIGGL